MLDHVFAPEAAATAPLSFNYPITTQVSLVTTVSGDQRNIAAVSIVYSGMTLWSGTMLPTQPTITIPGPIVAGNITIEAGGTFTMTPPSSSVDGFVMANLTIEQQTGTTPFTAQIAKWPLTS